MEQILGIMGLTVLAGVFLISFWRKYKKRTPQPTTPTGSMAGCESTPGPHCGQCPLGQNSPQLKLNMKGE